MRRIGGVSVILYDFEPAEFTLAGLRIGHPLSAHDKARLHLSRVDTEVTLSQQGGPETAEDWRNDLSLEVATVNGLVALVSTECLSIDNREAGHWTASDFVSRFGAPDRCEYLTDTLTMLHWRQGAMAAYFSEDDFDSFYISEAD